MKSLIRLVLFVAVIALIYYRFFGNEQEQEKSKTIINTGTSIAKDLGELTWKLLKKGKESLDKGDYNETLDNISGLIDDLKEKAGSLENAKEIYDQIAVLEQKRNELNAELSQSQVQNYDNQPSQPTPTGPSTEFKTDVKQLLKDTESLMNKVEGNK